MKENTNNTNTAPKSDIPPITTKVRLLKGDRVLWIIVPIMLLLSILVVYSSVANLAYRTGASNGTVGDLFLNHLTHIGIAVVALFAVYFTKSRFIYFISKPI